MNEQKPSKRLRFEDEEQPESVPKPRKTKLQFKVEEVPGVSIPGTTKTAAAKTTPATSGQLVPKLQQKSKFQQGDIPKLPGANADGLKPNSKATFYPWLYLHKKIHEAEHENVSIEAAHKTELAAEGTIRGIYNFILPRIRDSPTRPIRKRSKREVRANANYAYRKFLQDKPELKKKALARFYHRRRLKMRLIFQTEQAAQYKGSGIITKAAYKLKKVAAMFIKRNPKVWVIGLYAVALLLILQSCMAVANLVGSSMGGIVAVSSYLAEDSDIDAVTVLYTEWETDLEYRIQNAEEEHPGYDQYRYSIDDISHNPFELVAFLTAVYNNFTYDEVRDILYEIFNEQYNLEFIPETEIRTRTETR